MQKIMYEFKEKFPNTTGVNITEMKGLLEGTLVKVKVSGKKGKFILMTPADLEPGGKLDQMNAKIKQYNAEIRRQDKAMQAEMDAILTRNYYSDIIAKAEQYIGDIMYEMADGDMTKVELMSNEDLSYCRAEALYMVMGGRDITEALEYWNKRGF